MRVAVDLLGGDHAPREIVLGVAEALRSGAFVAEELLLVGPSSSTEALLREEGITTLPEILHTESVIAGHEKPVEALRAKPDASISLCVGAVRQGAADGLVAFGNTGAAVAASTMGLGLLPGIRRPGIAVSMLGRSGRFLLLDAGANPSPKPQHLFHYAVMGRAYAKNVLGTDNPRIGLLNIGGEASKGNEVMKQAYTKLEESTLPFVGNVEGNQLFSGAADVFVADGFVGNMVLKVVEGFAEYLVGVAGEAGDDSSLRNLLRKLLGASDFSEVGGALLLGLNGAVVIGHGRSRANAVLPALRAARAEIEAEVNRHIVEDLATANPGPDEVAPTA